ncbi:MAG: DUF7948 domain-containing protein [Aggregatilineales bacterium]
MYPPPVIEQNIARAAVSLARKSALTSYGALPVAFVANAGQIDPAVRFQMRSGSGILSFESGGVALSLPALTPNPSTAGGRGESVTRDSLSSVRWGKGPGVEDKPSVGIRLSFDGANPNAAIEGADQLPGIANFFIGSDPSQWHINVPTYAGVVYRNLYPGVDVAYTGQAGLLKDTYTLAAGVDPSIIRWRYVGADSVTLDPANGDLKIGAPDGVTLTEQAPTAWQEQNGSRSSVKIGYSLAANGTISFAWQSASYDPTLPLTIDPGLDYST